MRPNIIIISGPYLVRGTLWTKNGSILRQDKNIRKMALDSKSPEWPTGLVSKWALASPVISCSLELVEGLYVTLTSKRWAFAEFIDPVRELKPALKWG
jgi:hypothetical protein